MSCRTPKANWPAWDLSWSLAALSEPLKLGFSRGCDMEGKMSDFQCCFCGLAIHEDDSTAVIISFANLWNRGEAGSQDMFAHSACTQQKISPALSPSVPFEIEAFVD